MKQGIISLGEALIDFIPTDESNTTYYRSPGGAPANVAVGIARLGGKVGDDVLGKFLKDTFHHYGVNTNQMKSTTDTKTGLTFVTNAANGEREFDFYIHPSADSLLEIGDINETAFTEHKILHVGSISLIRNPANEATHHAVQLARENKMLVSYDPNLRLSLWENEQVAKDTIISILEKIDILKVSEEELTFITGESSMKGALKQLSKYNIPLTIVTLGDKGCYVSNKEDITHIPAMKVNAVDTTGAGDAFVSGILYQLDQYNGNLNELTIKEAAQIAEFASVSGALAASVKGAISALPTLEEVESYLQN